MEHNKYVLIIILILQITVRQITCTAQIITTFAGDGTQGYSGDLNPATMAQFHDIWGISTDKYGNVYIVDWVNCVIRKVDATGIITKFAGTGICDTFNGDGIQATDANLCVWDIAVDNNGNVLCADVGSDRVRKIDVSTGIITTIAGTGIVGFSGDSGPAILAQLSEVTGIFVDKFGNIYLSDEGDRRIRKINTAGIITTIAGNGIMGYSGDYGPATDAELNLSGNLDRVTADDSGNLYIPDNGNSRIRKIDTAGIISTIAGTGIAGYNGDGIAATTAEIALPTSVYKDKYGNIIFTDAERIRKINPAGIIYTIAGTGVPGYNGDNIPAIMSQLNGPACVTPDTSGAIYISDAGNYRVRKITGLLEVGEETGGVKAIALYPNPTVNTVTLEGVSNCEVAILDIVGRAVMLLGKLSKTKETLNISQLVKGIYFVEIVNEETGIKVVKKILKE